MIMVTLCTLKIRWEYIVHVGMTRLIETVHYLFSGKETQEPKQLIFFVFPLTLNVNADL